MAKSPTHVVVTGGTTIEDQIIDTILVPQTPTGTQALGDGVNPVTINYYNMQASNTTLSAQLTADYDSTLAVNNDANPLNNQSSGPITAQNFSWTTEQQQFFQTVEQVTDDLSFKQINSYNATNVDMVFAETATADSFLGGAFGIAVFPGTLPASSPHVTHTVVNGHNAFFATATTEPGVGSPRHSDLGHEVGHSMGMSHPHIESRIETLPGVVVPNPTFVNGLNGNGSGSLNAGFPAGFELNDNKYSMMSYQWATNTGLNPTSNPTPYGQNVGPMAIDIAAMHRTNGIGSNNTGDTTYNLTDGAQITDPKSNNAALDIDGADESRVELGQAYSDAVKTGGVWEGMKAYASKVSEQIKSGRFDGGEESIGRAYKTIYDGEREVDAAGKESIGNGGMDEISYAGSQQSALINLNDAGLGGDEKDAQYLDLQREIKGSGRWTEFNTEFQNEIDATVNDATGTLRPDAYSAGGHFSKLYTIDAAGKVTATQDGGYSIANGSVIENATGGDKADTLIGNEHDNVLTGNKGADALYGGHGNDTLNGGDGNDALVAGRGNNALDGGADFDTASYKNYYGPSIGVPVTQGVSFSITGSQATVTKPPNGAIAGPAGAMVETDSVKDVERFEGTDRNDVFMVENLSGNMYISGEGGDDTLTVKDPTGAYSLDMTGGTYPAGHPRVGESYTGTVSDGTNTIYLEDKDLNVTIDTPAPALEKSAELGIEDAIGILAADQKELNQQAIETGISTPAHEAINHPDAFQMIGNLHAAGVSTLKADVTPDMDIDERVGNILNAGREATQEAELLMPHERRAQETEVELGADYAQPIADLVYEDDYNYSM